MVDQVAPITERRVRQAASIQAELLGVIAERDALKEQLEEAAWETSELESQVWRAANEWPWDAVIYGPGGDEPDEKVFAVLSLTTGNMWRRHCREGEWLDVAYGHTYFESWEQLSIAEGPLLHTKTDAGLSYWRKIVEQADGYREQQGQIERLKKDVEAATGICKQQSNELLDLRSATNRRTYVVCVREPDAPNEYTVDAEGRVEIIDVDCGYLNLDSREEFLEWADEQLSKYDDIEEDRYDSARDAIANVLVKYGEEHDLDDLPAIRDAVAEVEA